MSSLNLSEWALKHRSFIVFIMIAVTLAGIASFFSLGRAEDPPFTFRTMIVQAGWPGATMDDTLQQVTERLERKLQETKGLDFLRSYTIPGRTTIFVNLKGSTKASEVPDIWYQVRKNIGDIRGTLPQGVLGKDRVSKPGFHQTLDRFGVVGLAVDLVEDVSDLLAQRLRIGDEAIKAKADQRSPDKPSQRRRGHCRGSRRGGPATSIGRITAMERTMNASMNRIAGLANPGR